VVVGESQKDRGPSARRIPHLFILTQPVAAANVLSSIAATLRTWATNFGTFISTSVSRL